MIRALATIAFLLLSVGCSPVVAPTAATGEQPTAAVAPQRASRPETAEAMVMALKARGLPITEMAVYTSANDPNSLLGRPGQYTGKANFQVERVARTVTTGDPFSPRNGGSVEVFGEEVLAKARLDYFVGLQRSGNALVGTEYDYQHGKAVLRLSSALTPEEAQAFDTALGEILR